MENAGFHCTDLSTQYNLVASNLVVFFCCCFGGVGFTGGVMAVAGGGRGDTMVLALQKMK